MSSTWVALRAWFSDFTDNPIFDIDRIVLIFRAFEFPKIQPRYFVRGKRPSKWEPADLFGETGLLSHGLSNLTMTGRISSRSPCLTYFNFRICVIETPGFPVLTKIEHRFLHRYRPCMRGAERFSLSAQKTIKRSTYRHLCKTSVGGSGSRRWSVESDITIEPALGTEAPEDGLSVYFRHYAIFNDGSMNGAAP